MDPGGSTSIPPDSLGLVRCTTAFMDDGERHEGKARSRLVAGRRTYRLAGQVEFLEAEPGDKAGTIDERP